MKKLVAGYVNDPENDYNIMVEILSGDEEIVAIRKVDNEYKMIVYKTINDVEIPLTWLKDVIQSLKDIKLELKESDVTIYNCLFEDEC